MKQKVFLLSFTLIFISFFSEADSLRVKKNNAFKRGESLKYRVFYDSWLTSWMTAGIGTVDILEENKKFHARDTYHMRIVGKSKGLFNLFFKVRDRFESYMDEKTLAPWYFIRRTREGDYIKNDEVEFNQFRHTAKSRTMEREVPPYVQDIVSSFYYMRTFDYSNLQKGDKISVKFHLDDSVYVSGIYYLGIDTIDTKFGKVRCMVLKPKMVEGEMFDEEYPMTLWVSDDKNRIPLLFESEVIIGSVKIELIEYKNLSNPFSSLLE